MKAMSSLLLAGGISLATASMTVHAGELVVVQENADATKSAILKKFEAQNPDVKVKLNIFDRERYKNSLIRGMQSGDAPDIATAYAGTRQTAVNHNELFEDVSDVWEANGLNTKLKAAAVSMTVKGRKWGVPWSYYQWGIYYRKDLFEKYKIAPPKNWAELVSACATFKTNNITPFAVASKATWPLGAWFDYLNMRINGYEFHMDLTGGKVPYTDKRVQAVFDKWDELAKPGYYLPNHQSYQWQDAVAAFAKGDAAMMLMANFAVPVMKERGLAEAQIGFLQFPEVVRGVPMAEDAPTEAYFIPAHAKNKADARRFLAFIARPEIQAELNASTGQLPVNRDSKMQLDVHQRAGAEMLASAYALAEYYDRDALPDMAKAGLDGFQQYLLKPADRDAILKRLEAVRQQVYK